MCGLGSLTGKELVLVVPRSNRPKGRKNFEGEPLDIERLTMGFRRTEHKHGYSYTVQPIGASKAQKMYTCPGCNLSIEPGVEHLVAWKQDGIMGDAHDVSERRHWHKHCWRIF